MAGAIWLGSMSLSHEQSEEMKRIRRVSDMLSTSHAMLRDRFARRALILDLLTLAFSTCVVALAFVAPNIAERLTPFHWDSTLWLGILSVLTFFATLVQLKTDWKSKSDAHRRTLDLYAEVKREAVYLLAADREDEHSYTRVLARYDMASAVGIEVPEKDFLALKRQHKLKVTLSKHLDEYPSTSLRLFRVKLWFRDNGFRRRQ